MVDKIKSLVPVEDFLRTIQKPYTRTATYLDDKGSDPWVIYKDGWYYYCRVNDLQQIVVNKARNLNAIGRRNHVVWEHPLKSRDAEVWAPELHFIQGKWYIYVTFGKSAAHRMYALEAKTDDPQGEYILKGKVADSTDRWAIDGTIMELSGQLYFIWAGWETEVYGQENLYIARMSNPWTISSERVCISQPEYALEKCSPAGRALVNEGPQVLQRGGKTFIIYSASYATIEDYCLGQLTLVGSDPMQPQSWVKKDTPVFSKTEFCHGPGHASFVRRRDGSDWIVYHSVNTVLPSVDIESPNSWARNVIAQRFRWNADGSPNFGQPLPPSMIHFKVTKLHIPKIKLQRV